MPELKSGEYKFDLRVKEILGDVGDRSLAGVRYLVCLGFRHERDLIRCGFANCEPHEIRTDGTKVLDEPPDMFFRAIHDALNRGRPEIHRTVDGQLTIAISPGTWDDLLGTCEPLDFRGDPENVFRVVVVVNPRMSEHRGPIGGGVALVLPVHRFDLESFLGAWLSELDQALRTPQFLKQDHDGHLLRWMPKRE